jgi:hypothetical protein
MPSSKEVEGSLIEGLDSDIEAIHSNASQPSKEGRTDVSRIDFKGDLSVGQEDKLFLNLEEN